MTHVLGTLQDGMQLDIAHAGKTIIQSDVLAWQQIWSETSYHLAALRDNPACAKQAFDAIANPDAKGLFSELTYDVNENIAAPYIHQTRPNMAVLREQGVNGQVEMAAAFDRAGFTSVDVHMSDLIAGRVKLEDFQGLVACGGFSFGDVLGAGRGWASSVLYNPRARDEFESFFQRDDSFALGVCNGCQMMSQLKDLIPGASHWPSFQRNLSEQFEARLLMVEVMDSPSILMQDMQGSKMPLVVAHGEGRVQFESKNAEQGDFNQAKPMLRYLGADGLPTEAYPYNPNGSQAGLTGFTSDDGRFNIMMPHPERLFRQSQFSYHPQQHNNQNGEHGAWLRMFQNARVFLA